MKSYKLRVYYDQPIKTVRPRDLKAGDYLLPGQTSDGQGGIVSQVKGRGKGVQVLIEGLFHQLEKRLGTGKGEKTEADGTRKV